MGRTPEYTAHAEPIDATAAWVALDALDEGIVVYASDGSVVASNRAAARILGRMPGAQPDPEAPHEWRLIREDGTPMSRHEHPPAITLATGEACDGVIMGLRRPDGARSWLRINSRALPDGGAVSTFTDITEQRRARAAAAAAEQLFRRAFDDAPIGMALTTLRTETARFVIVNRSYADMLGYDRAALRGLGPVAVTHPEDRDAMITPRSELISGRLGQHRMEIRLLRADGSVLWASLSRSVVRAADGRALFLVAYVEDVTERRAAREEMARQARTDPLTGVANRRVVHVELTAALAVGRPAVVYCDLDDFKAVNDNLGHDAGDRVLREVAARLVTIAGASGTVARVGGDEFVVVLAPEPSPDDVERVLRNIANIDLRVPLGGDTLPIAVTAGAAHRQPGDTAETLVERADRAMYSVKAAAAATA